MRKTTLKEPTQSAEVLDQAFEMTPVEALKLHPRNPRKGSVGEIWNSIEANGFFGAVVAQKSTGHVLVGNHRLLAALEHGIPSLPVLWVDVDDDRAVRILLADNRTSDDATYDNLALSELLSELSNSSDLTGTGYQDVDLDKLIESLVPKDNKDGEPELVDSWAVYVDCENEVVQAELLERLSGEGFTCRALIS